jgi:hypothetical protein
MRRRFFHRDDARSTIDGHENAREPKLAGVSLF